MILSEKFIAFYFSIINLSQKKSLFYLSKSWENATKNGLSKIWSTVGRADGSAFRQSSIRSLNSWQYSSKFTGRYSGSGYNIFAMVLNGKFSVQSSNSITPKDQISTEF